MESKKYVPKKNPVCAIQWTGDNIDYVKSFVPHPYLSISTLLYNNVYITTNVGLCKVEVGDYIIKRIYPENKQISFEVWVESLFTSKYELFPE